MDWIDPAILIVYLLCMFGVGLRFLRRQNNTEQYYTASGTIPAWAIGISLMSTLISSITFFAYPGQGYAGTWLLLVQGLMVPVVLLCILWFIVPCYRHVIGISTYEYFEKRFGYGARVYASLGFIIANFSKMSFVVFLTAGGIQQVLHLNILASLVIVGTVGTLATLLGGIEAVIWAEVIQGFILISGAALCLGLLLFKPTGNPVDVISTAYHAHKMSMGPYNLSFAQTTFWVMAVNGIFYALQKYGTDQTVVQRFLVAKSDRDAIKASLIGVFLCVPVWTLFMFIGSCLWAFYKLTAIALPKGIKPDSVFQSFIATQLPRGAMGLVMAALVSATLATLQSDLNCLSAIFVEDYYRRLAPKASDRQRLWVGKLTVVLAGLGAVGLATLYAQLGEKNVLATIFDVYAIFSGGIAGLFLLAFLTRRANRQGAWCGIVACILFTAWAFLTSNSITFHGRDRLLLDLGGFNYTQPKLMLGVYSHLVMFGVGYLASMFFARIDAAKALTLWGWLEQNKAASKLAFPIAFATRSEAMDQHAETIGTDDPTTTTGPKQGSAPL